MIAFARKTGRYAVLLKPDLAVLALTYAMDAEAKSSSASTSSESFVSAPATQEQPRDNIDDVRPAGSLASTRAAGPFTAPKASPQGSVKKPVEVEQSQGGDGNNNDQSGEEDDKEEQAFLILPSGPSELCYLDPRSVQRETTWPR